MMALAQKEYESSIGAEKITTMYKWVLNDWSLLYDIHYSKNVRSEKFLLNGTAGVLCRLTFAPNNSSDAGKKSYVKIEFSQSPTFLTMVLTISSITNESVREVRATKVYDQSVPSTIKLPFNVYWPKVNPDLIDDALTLFVEFTIVKSVAISSFPNDLHGDNFAGSFRDNLKEILDSKSFYDVTFDIEDEILCAHKVILAAKSEVFKAMFVSGMKEDEESKIIITDVEAEVFAEFLNYIYVGKVKNLGPIVDELIVVADKYQVDDLKTMCENYMSAYLDVENVVRHLLIAYKLCCEGLKKKALDLIKLNTRILANEANYRLLVDYPSLIREVFGN